MGIMAIATLFTRRERLVGHLGTVMEFANLFMATDTQGPRLQMQQLGKC